MARPSDGNRIRRRNRSRYNVVNRRWGPFVRDENRGGLRSASADRPESLRGPRVREPRPRRGHDGGRRRESERRESRPDLPRPRGTRGPRARRGHVGPSPSICGPGDQRGVRHDRRREALGARETRRGPEDVPRSLAEVLRADAGAADRAPPGNQGQRADLPDPAAVRLHRESGGPRLHDDEGPSALVPRRDQRSPPRGDATRGEGAARGGHQRNERGAHGPSREIRPAATRGPPARAVHHRRPRLDLGVPHSRREDPPRRRGDRPVDEQPGLRQGPSRVLREVVGLRSSCKAAARGPPRALVVIENENGPRFRKKTMGPIRRVAAGRRSRLSKRIVGLALLAMALVTAAFAVTVARADDESGLHWNAVLAGINERPAPRDTRARGVAIFQLSADGESIHYKVIAANINNVIMAHIHLGDANTAGPVIVWLYPIGGPPPPGPRGGRLHRILSPGDFDATKFVGPLAGKPMSALVENLTAGTAYVNIHTDDGVAPPNTGPGDFPGGEIRGQVKPTD